MGVRATDPSDVIIHGRTDAELEEFLLFAIVVAGKTAATQVKALHKFLNQVNLIAWKNPDSPFERIRVMIQAGKLDACLRGARLGQYKRLEACFTTLVNAGIDLRACGPEELEAIPGIGRKTSRFFIMDSREGSRFAALDTHLLKFLRDYVKAERVPKSTPTNPKEYARLEKAYLDYADSKGLDPSQLDLHVWVAYAQRGGDVVGVLKEQYPDLEI
jgi:hypothetical protein